MTTDALPKAGWGSVVALPPARHSLWAIDRPSHPERITALR